MNTSEKLTEAAKNVNLHAFFFFFSQRSTDLQAVLRWHESAADCSNDTGIKAAKWQFKVVQRMRKGNFFIMELSPDSTVDVSPKYDKSLQSC